MRSAIRHPRVAAIAKQSRKLDGRKTNQGILMEYTVYYTLWFIVKFPSIGGYSIPFPTGSLSMQLILTTMTMHG